MKAFSKDFFREFSKNRGRFISVFFIVLLGAAFFSGIRSAKSDMHASANKYYKLTKFMDLQVLGTLGVTDDDIEDIKKIDGVKVVEGEYNMEAVCKKDAHSEELKVIGITKNTNNYVVVEGKAPKNNKECMVDEKFLNNTGYKVGDTITLVTGTSQKIKEQLKNDKYKIVGICVLPSYMDINRGNSTLGDGKLDSFIVVNTDVFKTDIYSALNIRIKESTKHSVYDMEYKKIADDYADNIKKLEDKACQRRYNFIYSEAYKEIKKGEDKIKDAEDELDSARDKIKDGWREIDKANRTIKDKEKELHDAKNTIEGEEKKLKDASNIIEEKEKELNAASKTIETKEKEIVVARKEITKEEANLEQVQNLLLSEENKLTEAYKLIELKEKELALGKENIELAAESLNGLKAVYDSYEKELEKLKSEESKNQQESENQQDSENKEQIEDQQAQKEQLSEVTITETEDGQIDDNSEQIKNIEEKLATLKEQIVLNQEALLKAQNDIETGEKQIAKEKEQISSGKNQLEMQKEQITYGKSELLKAKNQISYGEDELVKGKEQISSGKAEIKEAKKSIKLGNKELAKARSQIVSGEKELKKGKDELQSNIEELKDAEKKFEKEEKEALDSINDGKADLKEAKEELDKIEVPSWYVNTREDISSCKNYELDADRIHSLGDVFPLIFFMVAALVSLTAMTRMVEEQRQQIGILKALGYSKRIIQIKYLSFAILPTLFGAIAGVLIGEKVLPLIIILAYNMLYTGLTEIDIPYNWEQGGMAIIVCVACTGIATLFACYKATKTKPSELMRPKAPKRGRRVILEHIFIWKHLNFSIKSTFRNIFRYKKRLFMTIIGVGGCMGLILVALGLRDSIMTIPEEQFTRLINYDVTIYLENSCKKDEIEELHNRTNNNDNVKDVLEVYYDTIEAKKGRETKDVYLIIPDNTQDMDKYILLNDRETHKKYDIPKSGICLSEKTANELHVKTGDKIQLHNDNEKVVEVEVKYIVENYLDNYIYMSKEQYKKLYDKDIVTNQFLVNLNETTDKAQKKFGEYMMDNDGVMAVWFISDTIENVNKMLDSLTAVVYVLLISAGLLAFIVIYNLNNINIAERQRELATLKVLGFYDDEVSNYVFRENVILTLLGLIAGLFIGTYLHRFVITSITMDGIMFGMIIKNFSYLLGSVITVIFVMLVNVFMNKDLKKIDMIESLKSVE